MHLACPCDDFCGVLHRSAGCDTHIVVVSVRVTHCPIRVKRNVRRARAALVVRNWEIASRVKEITACGKMYLDYRRLRTSTVIKRKRTLQQSDSTIKKNSRNRVIQTSGIFGNDRQSVDIANGLTVPEIKVDDTTAQFKQDSWRADVCFPKDGKVAATFLRWASR